MWYYVEAVVRHRRHPGVAKFGIALEWGSRGLEFESRHSDQKVPKTLLFQLFSVLFYCIYRPLFLLKFRCDYHCDHQYAGKPILAIALTCILLQKAHVRAFVYSSFNWLYSAVIAALISLQVKWPSAAIWLRRLFIEVKSLLSFASAAWRILGSFSRRPFWIAWW